MIKSKIIYIMFTTVLMACESSETNAIKYLKIDINAKEVTTKPAVNISNITALETSNNSMFGSVDAIEHFQDKIYILDFYQSRTLFVFNHHGTLLNKTKLGKGSGELIKPNSFFVNKKESEVIVYDQNLRDFFHFDLNLNFKSKAEYRKTPILNFSKISDNELLVRSDFNKDYSYTFYSKDFSEKYQFLKPEIKYFGSQSMTRSICSTPLNTMVIAPLNYSIYEFDGTNMKARYFLNFIEDHNIDEDDLNGQGIGKMWKLVKSGKKVSSPMSISLNRSFLLFNVIYKGKSIHYLLSLETEKLINLNDYFRSGILPYGRILGLTDDNELYALIEPADLMNFQEEFGIQLIESDISDSQNPFFLSFSIEDF